VNVARRRVAGTLAAVAVTLLLGTATATSATAADAVPYNDQYATGTITLCDKDLQPITSGSINDLPFVWRAVGSQAAPAPYNDGSGAAILYAFLPRQGVDAGQWNGELLTGSTIYQDPKHPMAQATPADWMLRYFSDDYIPKWDGFIELRLYYQHQGAQQSAAYAAADIQVTGDKWRLVRGGNDDCGSPTDAKSVEVSLPQYDQYVKRAARDYKQYFTHRNLPVPTNTATPGAPDATAPTPAASGPSGQPAPGPSGGPLADDSTPVQSGVSWWPVAMVLFAVAILAVGMVWWRRGLGRRS
jgi:hypothetical protein